jgi:RNA polymerase sigma-70 factor (ECF subfamily)
MSTDAAKADPYASIAAQFRSGDRKAFQTLYDALSGDLLAYLRPRCLGELDYEDFAQAIWLHAWQKRELFSDGHFRGWLYQIVRNKLADEYRRLRRQGVRVPIVDENVWDEIGWTVAVKKDNEDALDAMRRCMEEVGGAFVSVLKERLQGKTDSEIAEQLNMTVGAIQTRASRGRDQLRECIERRLA